MALRELSIDQMLASTQSWEEGGEHHEILSGDPVLGPVLARVLEVRRAMVTMMRGDEDVQSELANLTTRMTTLDAEHDRKMRAVAWAVRAATDAAESSEDTEAWSALYMLLFPQGLDIIQRAYSVEAGRAEILGQMIEREDVSTRLTTIHFGERSALDLLNQGIQAARDLGIAQQRWMELRQAHEPEHDMLDLRVAWIRNVHGLFAVAELSELSPDAMDAALASVREVADSV